MSLLRFFSRKKQRSSGARGFDAAAYGRLSQDWTMSCNKINSDIRYGAKTLVTRSRDLVKNSAEMIGYLRNYQKNVIGSTGFVLECCAKDAVSGKYDDVANRIIEAEFAEWGKKKSGWCTASGQQSLRAFTALVGKTVKIDGEAFIQKIYDAKNPWRISFKLLDTLMIDYGYNDTSAAGNRIIMGIEVDKDDRPLAYYLTVDDLSDFYGMGGRRVRVPAKDIIHVFEVEFAGQMRGIPSTVRALMPLHYLNAYREAELVAARIAACQVGVYHKDESAAGEEYAAFGDDESKKRVMTVKTDVAPGEAIVAPDGYKYTQLTPNHPGGNFQFFEKSIKRSIAYSVGVSYNNVFSDLESVNFSSLRAGELADRSTHKEEQAFLVENFLEVLFEMWLEGLLISGKTPLPIGKFDKFNQPFFRGRGWSWVNPVQDINAAVTAVNNFLMSPQEYASREGVDPEDILDEIADFEKMKKEKGLVKNGKNENSN